MITAFSVKASPKQASVRSHVDPISGFQMTIDGQQLSHALSLLSPETPRSSVTLPAYCIIICGLELPIRSDQQRIDSADSAFGPDPSVRELSSKVRCGACAATPGISVQSVKRNVKTSVASTLNLAVR
jgi:hypothetical protein